MAGTNFPHIKKAGPFYRVIWSEKDTDYTECTTYSQARRHLRRGTRPSNIDDLIRALEAGNYNAAPSTLANGAPLTVEDISDIVVTYDDSAISLSRQQDDVAMFQHFDISPATGAALDTLAGQTFGYMRNPDETDEQFRRRMNEALSAFRHGWDAGRL